MAYQIIVLVDHQQHALLALPEAVLGEFTPEC